MSDEARPYWEREHMLCRGTGDVFGGLGELVAAALAGRVRGTHAVCRWDHEALDWLDVARIHAGPGAVTLEVTDPGRWE